MTTRGHCKNYSQLGKGHGSERSDSLHILLVDYFLQTRLEHFAHARRLVLLSAVNSRHEFVERLVGQFLRKKRD